jgi:hypothetical protein
MGYLFLLLASALLGLFVEALAYRSGWAVVAGVALGGSLFAAVVGFRKGAMKLAQCGEGDPLHCVNILSEPLRQEDVDQYYVNYRGGWQQPRGRSHVAVSTMSPGSRRGTPSQAGIRSRPKTE